MHQIFSLLPLAFIITGPYKTEREFSVLNNYSLFNRNFAGFLAAVRVANPAAEVQEMTLGRL